MSKERKDAVKYLKTAAGQIEGIIKMIDDSKYCIDISNQILASLALLKKANMLILKGHLSNCVVEAVKEGNEEEKLDEIMKVLSKVIK